MNIVFYNLNFKNGGVEKFTIHLCNFFVSNRITVKILIGSKNSNILKQASSALRINAIGTSIFFVNLIVLFLYALINKTDVIFTDRYHSFVIAGFLKRCNLLKSDVYMILHSQLASAVGTASMRSAKQAKRFKFLGNLIDSASGVIAVSDGTLREFTELFPNYAGRKVVIKNPVFVEHIVTQATQPLSTKHLELFSRPGKKIISVGRLEAEKNFSLLLSAFSQILADSPAQLIICGEGREHEKLEHLIKTLGLQDSVTLTGFVDNPYNLMASSDLFVLSSNSEAFGIVLLEAMVTGLTIVATDCPTYGPREILDNGQYGYLVNPDDADALAKAMIKALNQPVSQILLEKRLNEFSVADCANKYLEFAGKLN